MDDLSLYFRDRVTIVLFSLHFDRRTHGEDTSLGESFAFRYGIVYFNKSRNSSELSARDSKQWIVESLFREIWAMEEALIR